ncbi:cation-translocating P-type ATPase [Caldicellulosiruptoraceae bacterium PP1]
MESIIVKNKGLSEDEANKRIDKFGLNDININNKKKVYNILLDQFKDILIIILAISTAISFLLGEWLDAIVIFIIIIINGILGFIQEFRAEKAIESLQSYISYKAKVIRNGKVVDIDTKFLTIGDIVIVEEGDRIPADGELLQAKSLSVDESLLTGESVPVMKSNYDDNKVYMGTYVVSGKGVFKVTSVGLSTKMGSIARMISEIEQEKTPLQQRLNQFGKWLALICLSVCFLIVILGILRHQDIYEMFMIGISLSVAAIPEGLPAVVTITLAIGVQRMVKKNALIRKLSSVETLGCVDIICTDKTGTLTENKMTVKKIETVSKMIEVEGNGYDVRGRILQDGKIIKNELLDNIVLCSKLCNNATFEVKKEFGNKTNYIVKGDPTEIALLVFSYKYSERLGDFERIDEIPFDSDKKYMAVYCKHNSEYYLFVKGALENLLEKCSFYMDSNGEIKELSLYSKKIILEKNAMLCNNAMRVLCLCMKKNSKVIDDLIFLGLVGMIDPPKRGVKVAIERAKKAGIKTIMITGDHKLTAYAIGKDLGIANSFEEVAEGNIFENDEADYDKYIDKFNIFARVSPKHKLKIVRTLKKKNHIVAMTGDGVNDAPAIKESDIGISMGLSGTDVTKNVASMVLLDDNYSTIISAVEEGRIIYNNIRKFIKYLLACNIGEVFTMFLASLLFLPLPLLPMQILWVNLVTDGLPAAALSVCRPDEDLMEKKPRKKDESIFADRLMGKIIVRGILIGITTLISFYLPYKNTNNIELSRTCAFATLVISQLIYAFECTSERRGIFEINIFSNIYLFFAILISLALFLAVILIPSLGIIFNTYRLTRIEWIIVLACATTPSIFNYLIEKDVG